MPHLKRRIRSFGGSKPPPYAPKRILSHKCRTFAHVNNYEL
ncbi:hypothetical protein CUS_6599 [Ruminococcus albus 8]|uniref:Uncharacterized protein n=1 Tax=Ruminococcus albus 8 TaxID=246199 RepID=E9SBC6_RUMAL|nr:hypothetical protein CUS_6599 [Ruminococcus albus 8]